MLLHDNGQRGHWLNHGDHLNGVDDDEYDPDRPVIDKSHMCTLACDGVVVGLLGRFSQPSTIWALYRQLLAQWKALKTSGRLDPPAGAKSIAKPQRQWQTKSAPTYSTFQRRWQAVWWF